MTRTARRLGLAVAGVGFAALAAFATASPAAADNGPHVLLSGSMVSSADGCAGCHRMHGASVGGDELFRNAAEGTAFCYTCHSGGTGATTNVKDGVSTVGSVTDIDTNAMNTRQGTYLNLALRGGGFENNRVGASTAVQGNMYFSSRGAWSPNKYAATGQSTQPTSSTDPTPLVVKYDGIHPNSSGDYFWGNLIPVTASKTTVSNHTLEQSVTMWGSGTTAGDAGASVTLECINCHNPHGNGNYRILRPYGYEGDSGLLQSSDIRNVFKEFNTVTAYTAATLENGTTVGYNSGKYMYTVTTSEIPTLVSGQPAVIRAAGTGSNLISGTVYSVDTVTKTLVIGNSSQNIASAFSGTAYLMTSYPSTIVKVETNTVAGTYKFTVAGNLNLLRGQVITISTASGASSPFALKQATIETTTATTFILAVAGSPAPAGMELGLYVDGIPDALGVQNAVDAGTVVSNPGIAVGAAGRVTGTDKGRVYTTANYFLADDMYYSGTYQSGILGANGLTAGTGVINPKPVVSSPFIASVSQWCSSCHTRYMSTNRKMNGVAVTNTAGFGGYKHQTGSGSQGSPNCISCHVAHGTGAAASGAQSSALPTPAGVAGGTSNSVLLRVDNRGVCLMCHNPYGVS